MCYDASKKDFNDNATSELSRLEFFLFSCDCWLELNTVGESIMPFKSYIKVVILVIICIFSEYIYF